MAPRCSLLLMFFALAARTETRPVLARTPFAFQVKLVLAQLSSDQSANAKRRRAIAMRNANANAECECDVVVEI